MENRTFVLASRVIVLLMLFYFTVSAIATGSVFFTVVYSTAAVVAFVGLFYFPRKNDEKVSIQNPKARS